MGALIIFLGLITIFAVLTILHLKKEKAHPQNQQEVKAKSAGEFDWGTYTKFDAEVLIPKQFIEDVYGLMPNCRDEDITYLFIFGDDSDIKSIANKNNIILSDKDIEWLKNRLAFFRKKIENMERLKKEFSLFHILTFGIFK